MTFGRKWIAFAFCKASHTKLCMQATNIITIPIKFYAAELCHIECPLGHTDISHISFVVPQHFVFYIDLQLCKLVKHVLLCHEYY